MSIITKLAKHGHLNTTDQFVTTPNYEVIMGSTAYAATTATSNSDMDIVGVVVPPIEQSFPWVNGWIPGFGASPKNFEVMQQHGIEAFEKDYDVTVYGITKFFRLAAENNPNVLDCMWVPDNCVTHSDEIGSIIRKNRTHFLHRGAYHKFRGYAHQQFKRLESSPRVELVQQYGYDTKFAYHVVRLSLQCEQILTHHDIDFAANSEFIKAVRNGTFKTVDELREWYLRKESDLDRLYATSTLRLTPDMEHLKAILMTIFEIEYKSLANVYEGMDNTAMRKLEAIRKIINN